MLIGSDLQQAALEYQATDPTTDLHEGRVVHDGENAKVFLGKNWSLMGLPLGAIIPIASNLTGAWTAPASGVLKDGMQLVDGAAIHGDAVLSGTLPNLANDVFIMGSTVGGSVGGSNTHTHKFPHVHNFAYMDDLGSGTFIMYGLHSNWTDESIADIKDLYDDNANTLGSLMTVAPTAGGTGSSGTDAGAVSGDRHYSTGGAYRAKVDTASSGTTPPTYDNPGTGAEGADIETETVSTLPKYVTAVYVARVA